MEAQIFRNEKVDAKKIRWKGSKWNQKPRGVGKGLLFCIMSFKIMYIYYDNGKFLKNAGDKSWKTRTRPKYNYRERKQVMAEVGVGWLQRDMGEFWVTDRIVPYLDCDGVSWLRAFVKRCRTAY